MLNRYNYRRRPTRPVHVGTLCIGGDAPIALQSMTNTDTNDVEASLAQTLRLHEAGADLVRLTTQGVREAEAVGTLRKRLEAVGVEMPLSADVHFNPAAALKAASTVQKVRINPGNFADAPAAHGSTPKPGTEHLKEALKPLIDICRKKGTALRLGVNHGSLSGRIVEKYGDTPEGMVQSVMEYLDACTSLGFPDIVISMKASNTVVMVRAVRRLVEKMDARGYDFPLHLGVTEAGDGEDGRIKSAVGIGTLLAEGLGDTIRVSLSEDPEAEIPVARALRDYITARARAPRVPEPAAESPEPTRLSANPFHPFLALNADKPDTTRWHRADAGSEPELFDDTEPVLLSSTHLNPVGEIQSWTERFVAKGGRNPIILSLTYTDTDEGTVALKAAADFGTLLLNGHGAGIALNAPALPGESAARLELGILQAARLRFTRPEYIACPGCGRTMFPLQETLAAVREATASQTGLKIGVMGCVVNGPGEMADADYGYVGAAKGRVSLYRGKECVERNIPASEAIPRLVALIKSDGRWTE